MTMAARIVARVADFRVEGFCDAYAIVFVFAGYKNKSEDVVEGGITYGSP